MYSYFPVGFCFDILFCNIIRNTKKQQCPRKHYVFVWLGFFIIYWPLIRHNNPVKRRQPSLPLECLYDVLSMSCFFPLRCLYVKILRLYVNFSAHQKQFEPAPKNHNRFCGRLVTSFLFPRESENLFSPFV